MRDNVPIFPVALPPARPGPSCAGGCVVNASARARAVLQLGLWARRATKRLP